MQGCGCLLALVTVFLGLLFPPLWLLTICGVIMAAVGGRRTIIIRKPARRDDYEERLPPRERAPAREKRPPFWATAILDPVDWLLVLAAFFIYGLALGVFREWGAKW